MTDGMMLLSQSELQVRQENEWSSAPSKFSISVKGVDSFQVSFLWYFDACVWLDDILSI